MHWRLRILRGTLYSQVPFSAQLRALKRRLRPPSGEGKNAGYAVADGLHQIALLRRAGVPFSGTVMEMGTGWLPIIPVIYAAAGFERFILTDTEALLLPSGLDIAVGAVRRRLPLVSEGLGLTERETADALDRPLRYEYRAPWRPSLADEASADGLFSRCVLEHVRPAEIEAFLREARRMVRPGGWMCHTVDNGDHWSHIDSQRSRVAFLAWRSGSLVERFAALNHYEYSNRLRHADYLDMFRRTGWDIVLSEGVPDEASLADLARMRLAPPFDARDHRDLAILSSHFVLRNPA
jgi:SAM-dependent methyltransferase